MQGKWSGGRPLRSRHGRRRTCRPSGRGRRSEAAGRAFALFASSLSISSGSLFDVYTTHDLTYIWTLGVGRFPDALRRRVSRDTALREIARCFLAGAGMTIPGELARVTGLPRPDAGRGNRALVAEGYATMLAPGLYRLATSPLAASASPHSATPTDSPSSRS